MLQALTRSNTDFNSVAANLEGAAPPPAAASKSRQQAQQSSTAPLQLGRPQTDSQGRKQTLLVSVQPFGKPQPSKAPAKPAATDHVTTVVLKSTTPPPQGGKTPVPSGEVATSAPAPVATSLTTTPSPTLLKLNDAQATGGKVPPPLSSKHMFLKSIVEPSTDATSAVCASVATPSSSTLAVSKSATSLSQSSVPTISKPAVATCSPAVSSSVAAAVSTVAAVSSTVSAVTSSLSTANVGSAKATVSLTMSSLTVGGAKPATKQAVSPPKTVVVGTAVSSAVSSLTTTPVSSVTGAAVSTPTTTTTTTPTNPSRREGKRTHITRGTPISKNNELLLKTKFIPLRTSTILSNNKRNSTGPEPPTLVKINGVGSEPVLLIESKQLDSSDEDDRAYSNVQVQSGAKAKPAKRVDGNDAPGSQTKRLASLLAPLGTGSPVGSREMAGEPDGRADPDSSSESGSEPPALPQSPPPAVDPRPSFLHGLTARLASASAAGDASSAVPVAAIAGDKPRVPFKSSAVTMQQQRWSQLGAACAANASPRQLQAKAAATEPTQPAAAEPPQVSIRPPLSMDTRWTDGINNAYACAPFQAPSCSPPCSPESSPTASPHGTPPGDSCSRAQKRQAPKPPQEPMPLHLPLGALGALGPYAAPTSSSPPATESSSASTSPTRPALGRSASTGSSASPPSPVLSYLRKASLPAGPAGQSPVARQKDKRRASQHVTAPLPPIAPTRSESVPSALGQVALGHSVTLGAHSGHSIAQALAQANSFVSMAPSPGHGGQPQPSPRRGLSLSTDSLGPSPKHGVLSYDTERKKPGTKVRFSLRKFLGLAKEGGLRPEGAVESAPVDPAAPPQPRPRPRLEIIHPSDLSGRAVEVLRASGVEVRRQLQEQANANAQQQAASGTVASPGAAQARRNSDTSGIGDFSPSASSPPPTPGADYGSDVVKGKQGLRGPLSASTTTPS